MAKSNRERQAAFKARRPFAGPDANGERRLDTFISTASAFALERLARRYRVTKREMLERLVLDADKAVLLGIEPDSEDWADYFGPR